MADDVLQALPSNVDHSNRGDYLQAVKPYLFLGNRRNAENFHLLKNYNICRILTVDFEPLIVDESSSSTSSSNVTTKFVRCLDEPEADLLSSFDGCIEFISSGVAAEENVLVHCLAGVSRSSTIVLAYLMKTYEQSVDQALETLHEIYPKGKPNSGFLEQLKLFEVMGNKVDKTSPTYKQYRLQLLASQIRDNQRATGEILSGLIHEIKTRDTQSNLLYKCRKCRRVLFSYDNIISHEPGKGQESFKWHKRSQMPPGAQNLQLGGESVPDNRSQCTSYFVEPVEWMTTLLTGTLDGKLSCPKCNARLGAFNWAGSQCSCGAWITPSFRFHKNKVDESRSLKSLVPRSPQAPS